MASLRLSTLSSLVLLPGMLQGIFSSFRTQLKFVLLKILGLLLELYLLGSHRSSPVLGTGDSKSSNLVSVSSNPHNLVRKQTQGDTPCATSCNRVRKEIPSKELNQIELGDLPPL